MFFHVWILSHSVMLLRYIHVVDCGLHRVVLLIYLPASPASLFPWRTSAYGPWVVWLYTGVLDALTSPLQCPEWQINIRNLTSLGPVVISASLHMTHWLSGHWRSFQKMRTASSQCLFLEGKPIVLFHTLPSAVCVRWQVSKIFALPVLTHLIFTPTLEGLCVVGSVW